MNKPNWRYYLNKLLSVPIYIKITGILFLVVIALEFATVASIYFFYYKQEHTYLEKRSNSTGKIIADRVEDYIENNDIIQLQDTLRFELNHSDTVQYIIVIKKDGRIIAYASKKAVKIETGKYINASGERINAHSVSGGSKKGVKTGGLARLPMLIKSPYRRDMINLKFPILNDDTTGKFGPVGNKIGTLQIGFYSDTFNYFFKITITFIIFVFFPILIFAIIFFMWISTSILKPLSDLSNAAESAKNGNYSIAVAMPKFADEKLAGLITEFNDMLAAFSKTEYKWESKDSRRKEFLTEIIKAHEDERKTLSRELHDELEQFLIYINMKFGMLENVDSAALRNEQIKGIRKNILNQLDIIKNITKDLRPGLVYELGLYKAVAQYAMEIKLNHNIQTEIYAAGMEEFKTDEYIEISIYRIFQEIFSNTIRHSKASNVKIVMNFERCIFRAIIEDNGIGFKYNKKFSENYGINGMKERAEILGGTLYIKTKPGFGVTIIMDIPIK
ncbi:MAG: sensor histidine kinase [bacterium]